MEDVLLVWMTSLPRSQENPKVWLLGAFDTAVVPRRPTISPRRHVLRQVGPPAAVHGDTAPTAQSEVFTSHRPTWGARPAASAQKSYLDPSAGGWSRPNVSGQIASKRPSRQALVARIPENCDSHANR